MTWVKITPIGENKYNIDWYPSDMATASWRDMSLETLRRFLIVNAADAGCVPDRPLKFPVEIWLSDLDEVQRNSMCALMQAGPNLRIHFHDAQLTQVQKIEDASQRTFAGRQIR